MAKEEEAVEQEEAAAQEQEEKKVKETWHIFAPDSWKVFLITARRRNNN